MSNDIVTNEQTTSKPKRLTSKQAEAQEAIERLKGWIQPGDTIYTVLRHVSASGMQRSIQLVGIRCENGQPQMSWYGYNVAKALEMPYDDRREGVKINGTGMDMGFALVYDLAYKLFGDGYKLSHRWI